MCKCGHSVTSHDFLGCDECGCKRFRSTKGKIRFIQNMSRVEQVMFWVAVCSVGVLYLYFLAGVLGWIH